MAKDNSLPITDELVASFLDGNTTAEQTLAVLEAARHDADLRMLLEISHRVDDDMVFSITGRHIYDRLSLTPEEALAASDITTHNLCAVQCEAYILEQYDESISCDTLAEQARSNNWITPEGMPIANIGKLLELQGFSVSRKYLASIKDVEKALTDGNRVIAVIDGGELVATPSKRHWKMSWSEKSLIMPWLSQHLILSENSSQYMILKLSQCWTNIHLIDLWMPGKTQEGMLLWPTKSK